MVIMVDLMLLLCYSVSIEDRDEFYVGLSET